MSNAARDSQTKSAHLKVYAFEVARINAATLALKLRLLGGVASIRKVAVSELPTCIAQIEQALAEGADEVKINIGSGSYVISPELLNELKNTFSSYSAVSGGSGAQVVRKGASRTESAANTAKCGAQSKAPARAAAVPHCASDFNEERDRRIAKASAVRAEPFNGSGTAAADFENQLAHIVGDELRKAVMPVLAEIDAITALVKECASELETISKDFITRASGKLGGRNTPPAPRRKGGRDSYCPKAGRVNAEGSISTRRGRTSVVVGRRKVS